MNRYESTERFLKAASERNTSLRIEDVEDNVDVEFVRRRFSRESAPSPPPEDLYRPMAPLPRRVAAVDTPSRPRTGDSLSSSMQKIDLRPRLPAHDTPPCQSCGAVQDRPGAGNRPKKRAMEEELKPASSSFPVLDGKDENHRRQRRRVHFAPPHAVENAANVPAPALPRPSSFLAALLLAQKKQERRRLALLTHGSAHTAAALEGYDIKHEKKQKVRAWLLHQEQALELERIEEGRRAVGGRLRMVRDGRVGMAEFGVWAEERQGQLGMRTEERV